MADDAERQPDVHVLSAHQVAVHERHRPMLAATSLALRTGELVVASGDPGHRHTALALALGGRLVPDEGSVDLDGDSSPATLQRDVALVDVPGVSEPDDVVPAVSIVGEELAMAGRRAGAKHVATWLVDHDLAHVTDSTMEDLSPHDRVVMLTSLAAMRDARFLVVTLPERHGGLPDLWLPHLESLAGEGLGVLVTTSNGLTAHIPHAIRTVSFGDAQEDLG